MSSEHEHEEREEDLVVSLGGDISLDVLEERLKAYGFLRVHQSYLVNIRHIRSINNYVLALDTGEEMKVPKARYKQVKQERVLYMGKTL